MPSVWIEIEDEAQDAARRVVSNSYDSDEWCEPDSIRQDIKDLQEAVHIIRTSLDTLNKMIKMLSDKVYVQVEPAPDIGLDDDYRE
tara:strand:- start:106 stop:363 length:258 start_codon:yes stop_codon:yes gene_type:complete